MIHSSKKSAYFIVMLAVLLLALLGFSRVARGQTTDLLTSQGSDSVGAKILTILIRMKKITIEKSLWSNPIFLSLHDFTTQVVDEPLKRNNPFAPIGVESVSSRNGASASLSVDSEQTVSPSPVATPKTTPSPATTPKATPKVTPKVIPGVIPDSDL